MKPVSPPTKRMEAKLKPFSIIFSLSISAWIALLTPSLESIAAPIPTLLDGMPVLRVARIKSAQSVEEVITPAGNNQNKFTATHPDGRKEEVPGFTMAFETHSLLLRGAELDLGNSTMIRNIIFPNVLTAENAKERVHFFDDVFHGVFPTRDPFSSSRINAKNKGKKLEADQIKSKDDVPWDGSVVTKAELSDTAILVSPQGLQAPAPLISFTGKESDSSTEVLIGTAFYMNLNIDDSYSGTVQATKSTLSNIKLNSDIRVLVSGLTQSEFAASGLKKATRSGGKKRPAEPKFGHR